MWPNRHPLFRLFLFVALALMLSGCSGIRSMTAGLTGGDSQRQSETGLRAPVYGDVLEGSYYAADALAAPLQAKTGKTGATMLASSISTGWMNPLPWGA
jgi:hypothetical protein